MPVSKDRCQLCKMEAGHQKILDAAKGNVGRAIVASCITGIVGCKADPDIHQQMCTEHVAQLMAAIVTAIGVMAERAMREVEAAAPKAPEPPPQGKDVN